MKAFVGGLAPFGKAVRSGNCIDIYDSVQKYVTLYVDEHVEFPEPYRDCITYFTQVIRVEGEDKRVTLFFNGNVVEEVKLDGQWFIHRVTQYYVDRKFFNWIRCYVHVGYEKIAKSLYWLYLDVEYPTLLYTTDKMGKVLKENILEEPVPLLQFDLDVAFTQSVSMLYAMDKLIFDKAMNRVIPNVKEVNSNYAGDVPCLPTALSRFEDTLSRYFCGDYLNHR